MSPYPMRLSIIAGTEVYQLLVKFPSTGSWWMQW